ncbi:PTS sugar transporter subunit IIA [Victivallis sp. Marseille-Q1083]|uniref:PTS sugar transporter subunit IIA n=1 Tax=Victivallis sp. Marseille-Q1083 TaxID=2717288 RepID=UPI00158BDBEA|nr:PTS sugar transporter subunit IIA [Victivallis sp. Marseille-Q1083]
MKVSFSKYVTKDSIVVLNGKSKLEVLDELINRAADLSHLDRDLIFRLTWKRENMMTTGVGSGLGLPHIRVSNIPYPVILIGICTNPVEDYQSQDDQPVRVIVFIVATDEDPEAYLQLLGSISRKMRDPKMVDKIVENIAKPDEVLKLIDDSEE